ncbi:retroviral-like aspartic protease family protein [Roseateles sp. SL47]|uniref:aspartyl protease family protein n=1 Tax=Roseateles sp. SL47 TaxID=2995138 RepID=UPI0022708C4F|nr:aspartyl protease family protein [Roseateles sp. SL47]WAC71752.1 retroviral-like aspartic protease family protein [Roseateles sp. SL47]
MRIIHSRPVATLVLNGTEVPVLVDSGAFFSMLTESTAAQLQLPLRNLPFSMSIEGYTGAIDAQLTRVEHVGLRGAEMKRVEFIVGGNELGAGIMGILGRNILSVADTEYDLAHGVIRLALPSSDCAKANMAYWAGDAPVIVAPLERARGSKDTAVRVEVNINGKATTALMDTGAPETALTLNAAKSAGISKDSLQADGHVGGVGRGKAESYVGVINTFELSGEKISHSKMQINDADDSDGMVLGLDYFLAHRIYVSRQQQKIFATWNGSPIFARQKGGDPNRFDQTYAARPQQVDENNADALARRGNAFAANHDPERALQDLSRAITLAPEVAPYHLDRAQVLWAQRKAKEAMADLDEALRLDAGLADARLQRASVRLSLRRPEDALADMQVLDTQLAPSAQQRLTLADQFMALNRLPDALRQWALWMPTHENDTKSARALNKRCWARVRMNVDLPLAVEDCKESVSRDKTDAGTRDSLGWAYLRLGDAERSRKAFDAAVALKPDLAWALYGRGLANLALKDAAASQRDLQAARKLQPRIDERVRAAGFGVAPDAPPVGAAGQAPNAAVPAGEAASAAGEPAEPGSQEDHGDL